MKTWIILIAFAALLAGCARNATTGQGTGGYEKGSSFSTSTNDATLDKSTVPEP